MFLNTRVVRSAIVTSCHTHNNSQTDSQTPFETPLVLLQQDSSSNAVSELMTEGRTSLQSPFRTAKKHCLCHEPRHTSNNSRLLNRFPVLTRMFFAPPPPSIITRPPACVSRSPPLLACVCRRQQRVQRRRLGCEWWGAVRKGACSSVGLERKRSAGKMVRDLRLGGAGLWQLAAPSHAQLRSLQLHPYSNISAA